jgi:hypothetical protein
LSPPPPAPAAHSRPGPFRDAQIAAQCRIGPRRVRGRFEHPGPEHADGPVVDRNTTHAIVAGTGRTQPQPPCHREKRPVAPHPPAGSGAGARSAALTPHLTRSSPRPIPISVRKTPASREPGRQSAGSFRAPASTQSQKVKSNRAEVSTQVRTAGRSGSATGTNVQTRRRTVADGVCNVVQPLPRFPRPVRNVEQPSARFPRPVRNVERPSARLPRPVRNVVRPSARFPRPVRNVVRPSARLPRPVRNVVRPSARLRMTF